MTALDLPAPLVSAEVDLTGFSSFMLDVDHLLASELVAVGTPEECWAAHLLMCRAWKQSPPASLPDEPRILAAFSGAGKRWTKVAKVALQGFVKCSDGRLYHRELAREAMEAWARRKRFKDRSAKANERRWSGDHLQNELAIGSGNAQSRGKKPPLDHEDEPSSLQEGGEGRVQQGSIKDEKTVHQGSMVDPSGPRQDKTRQDIDRFSLRSKREGAGEHGPEPFDRWWEGCPHKVGKDEARKAFDRVIRDKRATVDELVSGMEAYRRGKPPDRQWCNPATWLNQGRWADQPADVLPLMGGRASPMIGTNPSRPVSGSASALAGIAAAVNAHREAS